MNDNAERMLAVLSEMRDLLRLIAEPAIAERDKKLRQALRDTVGGSASKTIAAIKLMDGTKTQSMIVSTCGIHKGQLSTLVKKLDSLKLLTGEIKQPKLAISIPQSFFEESGS